MQKTAAIVNKFQELAAGNDFAGLFPEQLMHLRLTPVGPPGAEQAVPSMARFFVDRVFEVHVHGTCPATKQPAMSLEEFADFLLAWNYRGIPPSTKCVSPAALAHDPDPDQRVSGTWVACLLAEWQVSIEATCCSISGTRSRSLCRYFWRCLDVEEVGYLSAPVITMWAQHVKRVLHEQFGNDEIQPRDVACEIFDLITPKDPSKITYEELLQSGTLHDIQLQGVVCAMLVDAACMQDYEQREEWGQVYE
jgi:hypothetical protein